MPQSLENRLAQLRSQVRRLLLLNGVCWLIAVTLGAMVFVGAVDWLLRFDDVGVRLILSLGIISASVWVGYRLLVAPLLIRLSDLDLALRIESRQPELKDSLASTVQFLGRGIDPDIGSPDLQRGVIDQTLKRLEAIEFGDILETRPIRHIAAVAGIVTLVTAILVGMNRADAAIALKRMVFPLSTTGWPKQTELQVLSQDLHKTYRADSPIRVATGQTFKVYFENAKGKLPPKGTVYFQLPEGPETSQQLAPLVIEDAQGRSREVFTTSIAVLEGPIKFRCEAGDDLEMPWISILPVQPPNLEDLQVTLTPPAYSGKPQVALPIGIGHIEGLLGTEISLRARSDKKLTQATLHVGEQTYDVEIAEDGLSLSANFSINERGTSSYWLSMRDDEQTEETRGTRYDLRGIEDAVPAIEITEPTANLQVTAHARVRVRISAKDDIGLKQMLLEREVSRGTSGQTTSEAPVPLLTEGSLPVLHEAEHVLELSGWELVDGDRVQLQASATDAYDLGPEHIGRSQPRVLTIVSDAEKKQELAGKQADIMADLEEARRQQQSALDQVRQLQIQLKETEELRPQDVDTLQRTEMAQRWVGKMLTDKVDGITRRARSLLEELNDNQIDDPETASRLTRMAEDIARVDKESLPRIEQALTSARKHALVPKEDQNENSHTTAQRESLDQASEHQQLVLESLDAILHDMSRWQTQRELVGKLEELIKNQDELNQKTDEIGSRTLAKTRAELTAQERADLERLADRQRQSAKLAEQWEQTIAESLEKQRDQDSAQSELLEDVADQLNEQAVAGKMQQTARQIQRNDMGGAAESQKQLLEQLQSLHDTLRNRRQTETAELVKKLTEAEQELAKLKDRQQELQKQMEAAEKIGDPQQKKQELQKLQQQQQQLRDEVARMSRQLRRLNAPSARAAVQRAEQRQQQSLEQLQKEDPEQAQQQSQEAVDDLEQAQRELARQRQQLEEQLAFEQLEKIADQLQAMIPRQQSVIDETRRLDDLLKQRGKWSRPTLASLRGLTEVQRGLQQETVGLMESLTSAEVFALALRGAARQMQRSSARLGQRQTDAETVLLQERAKQRFVDLVEALKPEKQQKQPKQEAQQPQQSDGGEQASPPTDGIPPLAQLKLLKTLQQDLQQRTMELAERAPEGQEGNPANQLEWQQLALEQGELADLARNLIEVSTSRELRGEDGADGGEE